MNRYHYYFIFQWSYESSFLYWYFKKKNLRQRDSCFFFTQLLSNRAVDLKLICPGMCCEPLNSITRINSKRKTKKKCGPRALIATHLTFSRVSLALFFFSLSFFINLSVFAEPFSIIYHTAELNCSIINHLIKKKWIKNQKLNKNLHFTSVCFSKTLKEKNGR